MKKLILIISFLTLTVSHAQQFSFDLLTKYRTRNEYFTVEKLVYANRNNSNYFLEVSRQDSGYVAQLLNLENLEIHFYDVKDTVMDGNLMFDFKYLRSQKISHRKEFYSYSFVVDSTRGPTKISVLKGKRKKKIGMHLTLKAEKSDYNLFPLFRVGCFHPFEIRKDLVIDGNYLIRSAEGANYFGVKCKCELLYYEEINLVLTVD